tara:strand:+ start:798 stop:1259 length:462 start_codon:yes stop_codon:yes gene_type:complete
VVLLGSKKLIRGFTLIELLVVVAILGVLAAIGTISYSSYVTSSKMSGAENTMAQISLAQTEYYSDTNSYYVQGTSCDPDKDNTKLISDQDNLGVPINLDSNNKPDIGFYFCVEGDGTDYEIVALADYGPASKSDKCEITFKGSDLKAVRNDNC